MKLRRHKPLDSVTETPQTIYNVTSFVSNYFSLSKKSRVPVKLEHSSSSNTNDVIKSSDVTIVSDDALQQEPAYASINDHNTDGTSGGNIKTWEQQQQTIIDQSDVPNVIYAELNKPQADSIAFENELIEYQNPPAQEGVQHEVSFSCLCL